MIRPMMPVSITRTIHRIELSMPRLLASRATQISNAMFRASIATMTTPKNPRQPQAARGLASSRCHSKKLAKGKAARAIVATGAKLEGIDSVSCEKVADVNRLRPKRLKGKCGLVGNGRIRRTVSKKTHPTQPGDIDCRY